MNRQFYQIHHHILNCRASSKEMNLLKTVHHFFKILRNILKRKKDQKCKNRMLIQKKLTLQSPLIKSKIFKKLHKKRKLKLNKEKKMKMTFKGNQYKLILTIMKMIYIKFLKDIIIRYLVLNLMKIFYNFGEILIKSMI